MSIIMKGAEVAKAMKEHLIRETEALKEAGVNPCLAIIRVGARPDDLAYERGAKKRMAMVGIECRVIELPGDIGQKEFEEVFDRVNEDSTVHGILLFRPLPAHLDEEPVKAAIHPYKDVDCMSAVNIAKVFSGDATGFAPCTAEAVTQMLDHYQIDPKGKKVSREKHGRGKAYFHAFAGSSRHSDALPYQDCRSCGGMQEGADPDRSGRKSRDDHGRYGRHRGGCRRCRD